ncbi:hypothetical protein L6261_04040 [Candidatus Parcubacteria bacterium]|nr:hypothetical protein [Candidatus Parcubacteria bacterium]
MNFKDDKKEIITAGLILAVLSGIFFVAFNYFKNDEEKEIYPNDTIVEELNNPYKDLSLEAKSAFVWDLREGKELYSLNGEAQLPLASITKLMTALVSSEMVPMGTILTINNEDIKVEGDSGLLLGEKWKLKDILNFTLMSSSNDGAHALASVIGFVQPRKENKTTEEMFVDAMNDKAKELGLSQTFFLNESGLDLNRGFGGAYGSAKDVAILMGNIVENNPEILQATKFLNLNIGSDEFVHFVENTNKIVEVIPGVIGSKTGLTDLAGGNLVIGFDVGINHPIIISVLGSSAEGRFSDMEKLVWASMEKVAQSRN